MSPRCYFLGASMQVLFCSFVMATACVCVANSSIVFVFLCTCTRIQLNCSLNFALYSVFLLCGSTYKNKLMKALETARRALHGMSKYFWKQKVSVMKMKLTLTFPHWINLLCFVFLLPVLSPFSCVFMYFSNTPISYDHAALPELYCSIIICLLRLKPYHTLQACKDFVSGLQSFLTCCCSDCSQTLQTSKYKCVILSGVWTIMTMIL